MSLTINRVHQKRYALSEHNSNLAMLFLKNRLFF